MTSPVRGVPGAARHEHARAESAGPSSEVPAPAAPALGALVAVPGLSIATAGRTARPAASGSASGALTIRRNFVLTKSYRPKTTGVVARPKFDPSLTDELEPSRVYRVTGFDFSGNMVLLDEQTGVEYLVAREQHSSFDIVEAPTGASAPTVHAPAPTKAPPVLSSSSATSSSASSQGALSSNSASSSSAKAPPVLSSSSASSSSSSASAAPASAVIGYADSAAATWENQRHENGCWLAALAVLMNRRQLDIQTMLGWADEAFFGITGEHLVEFCQMLKFPVEQIAPTEIARVHASLQAGHMVMMGVPEHMMVVFAIAADDSYLRVWDPADGEIQKVSAAAIISQAKGFWVRKGT
jgi:hypothetical protein